MKQKISRVVLGLVAILLGVISSTSAVYADETEPTVAMTVSPPNQEILLVPGESYRGSIDVSSPASESNMDLHYTVSLGSFSQQSTEDSKDDYGTYDTVAQSSYNQIMNWITLEKTEGVVGPGGKDTIPFTINVPKNAPAGGQYATILITDNTEIPQQEGDNVVIQNVAQFGSIIYAEVAGETKKVGSIEDNSIPSMLLNNKLEANSMVRNDGNVHTDAEYILQVWPLFSDEEICTNEEKPATSLILPETQRYHTETCNLPSVGIFRAKQTVKIFGETSIVEKTVIVCPIWLLFIIFFVIAAVVIWLVMRVRARGKQKGGRKETTNY